MSNGSSGGLLEQLNQAAGGQASSTEALAVMDAVINGIAKIYPVVGIVVGAAEGILSLIDPPPGSPTTQDLQNQISALANALAQQWATLQATEASGQVKANAEALEVLLTGPNGSLAILDELPTWRNSPGLPLPDSLNPAQYQIFARSAVLTLLGGGPASAPPDSRPTAYWWLPTGDLPLFQPPNPWTYLGTNWMFNQPREDLEPPNLDLGDANPYTRDGLKPIPQFDLSAFHFTNNFLPIEVAGIPGNNAPGAPITLGYNAFNPIWVLPQSMAAISYYLIICAAVLKNFPNDGATIPDFTGDNNLAPDFLGNLSWYHDQIRAGIVNIAPPYPYDLVPFPTSGANVFPASADGGVSNWSVPCGAPPVQRLPGVLTFVDNSQAAASAPASYWSRPFGALCCYTGYVASFGGPQPSVGNYPDYVYLPGQTVYPTPPAPHTEDFAILPRVETVGWYTGFYSKYLVASLWRTKLVYLGMGLADTWRTINNLYVMFGKAPRPGVCFGDWSLREVFRMLGSANYETFPLSDARGGIYVSSFLRFMNSAAPMPSRPLNSLRAVLQA